MKDARKEETITFKVEKTIADRLAAISNRSDFIRRAILTALNNLCPLCQGTGVLTPSQKAHWDQFSKDHKIVECNRCHAYHLICNAEFPETENKNRDVIPLEEEN